MKKICLNMIVRNEAGTMARCLASVRPIISYWVICDTGSTDGTQEIVRKALEGIPGELHEDEWKDFSHNRNLGLQRARGKADYHLMLDADFTVNIRSEWDASKLEADGYRLRFEGDIDWPVLRLVSDRHEWKYRGRVHEYLESPTAKTQVNLSWITLLHHADGGSRRGRLERYLELLLRDHEEDQSNPRTVFYIGMTYGDLEQYEKAIEWHTKRLGMGGWEEELWYSAYIMTRCKQVLNRPWPEVLQGYLECYEMRPTRLEPLQRICEQHRAIKHYELNYLLARPALATPYPAEDLIFVERPVYQFRLLMEFAVSSFWTRRFAEAEDALERVLAVRGLPANYKGAAENLLRNIEPATRSATAQLQKIEQACALDGETSPAEVATDAHGASGEKPPRDEPVAPAVSLYETEPPLLDNAKPRTYEGMIPFVGDLSSGDAQVLSDYARSAKRILEFGAGGSTQILAYYSTSDAEVLSLETEPYWIKATKKNLHRLGILKPVRFIHWADPAQDPLTGMEGDFDLIFVDGAPELRAKFYALAWNRLRPGGTILNHDTRRFGDFKIVRDHLLPESHWLEIESIQINVNDSNITAVKRGPLREYVNWNVIEGKEPWQVGYDMKRG